MARLRRHMQYAAVRIMAAEPAHVMLLRPTRARMMPSIRAIPARSFHMLTGLYGMGW